MANILRKESRKEDIIARWGGEEFVMIIPGTNAIMAAKQMDRIRSSLRNIKLKGTDGKEVLTLSGGIAEFPIDGKTETGIIDAADIRMLHAKQNGRDQIVLE